MANGEHGDGDGQQTPREAGPPPPRWCRLGRPARPVGGAGSWRRPPSGCGRARCPGDRPGGRVHMARGCPGGFRLRRLLSGGKESPPALPVGPSKLVMPTGSGPEEEPLESHLGEQRPGRCLPCLLSTLTSQRDRQADRRTKAPPRKGNGGARGVRGTLSRSPS